MLHVNIVICWETKFNVTVVECVLKVVLGGVAAVGGGGASVGGGGASVGGGGATLKVFPPLSHSARSEKPFQN